MNFPSTAADGRATWVTVYAACLLKSFLLLWTQEDSFG